jgi:hypothetical protein
MDEANLYFMDPSIGNAYGHLAQRDFVDRWHDYEIRNGQTVKLYQLALFIEGKNPLAQFPASLAPIE